MKICITSTGDNLEATVDPRFGRCQNFIIVDPQSLEFKAIANPNISAAGGAGIQSAQLVAKEGAAAVVTGKVGPNAFQILSSLGLKIFIDATGTVREALRNYQNNKLAEASGPSA